MVKKNGMLYIGIAVVVIFAIMASSSGGTLFATLGDLEAYQSCSYLSNQYYYGAEAGDCYVSEGRPYYIVSMSEKSSKCSLSPACPEGERAFCSVDTSSGWADVFSCDKAYSSSGVVEVCKYDTDCDSGICVNALCKDVQARDCSTTGETRCASASQFQKCLSNGKWSGILTCNTGTTCYLDQCMTQSQIDNTNTDSQNDNNNDGNGNGLPFDNQTLIYIGLIIGIILVILSLM